MSQSVDRRAIRKAIREYIEREAAPTWSEIAAAVSEAADVEPTAVGRELDELEAKGFIYTVPTTSGDGEEVRLV